MVAIVCSSPFHIFTAIILRQTVYEKCEVELVVLNYSIGIIDLLKRVRKEEIFTKIIFVDGKKILDRYHYKKDRLFKVFFLAYANKYLKKYNIDISEIDELVYPYTDPIAIIMALAMSREKRNNLFSFYDDGTGSYWVDFNDVRPPRLELFFRVPMRFFVPNRILTYYTNGETDRQGLSLQRISLPVENDFKDMLNRVFGYNIKSEEYRYIFFDQFGEYYDESGTIIKLLKAIDTNGAIAKDILVKKHPKRGDAVYERAGFMTDDHLNGIPYEIIALNDDSLDKRCLISDYSTALFTPKLIFNKEPRVIFLYKLLHVDYSVGDIQRLNVLYNNLVGLYSNKDRVMLPETVDELLICLK